jgi:hypothetical protein
MTQHLRDAQTDLSSLPTAGDIYHQQPAHQTNVTTITDTVVQHLLEDQCGVEPPSLVEPPPSAQLTDVANSLQHRKTDLQSREASMLTQMQGMMMMMSNGNNYNHNKNPRGNSQGRGRGRTRDRNTNRPTNRSHARSYCWSHGVCAHTDIDCRTPATGHQTTAMFANMQNGSTSGCYWMTWQVGTTDNIPINENLYCNTVVVPLSTFASHNQYAILDSVPQKLLLHPRMLHIFLIRQQFMTDL